MLKKKLSNITQKINLLILVENNIKNKLKINIRVKLTEYKFNNLSNITQKINFLILVENNIKNKLKIKIRVKLTENKFNNIKTKL